MPDPVYPALDLGPLPVDLINATIGTELEPGRARLSATAHEHMAKDHAADYPVCIAEIAMVSRITLSDVLLTSEFDVLPSSASRWL